MGTTVQEATPQPREEGELGQTVGGRPTAAFHDDLLLELGALDQAGRSSPYGLDAAELEGLEYGDEDGSRTASPPNAAGRREVQDAILLAGKGLEFAYQTNKVHRRKYHDKWERRQHRLLAAQMNKFTSEDRLTPPGRDGGADPRLFSNASTKVLFSNNLRSK